MTSTARKWLMFSWPFPGFLPGPRLWGFFALLLPYSFVNTCSKIFGQFRTMFCNQFWRWRVIFWETKCKYHYCADTRESVFLRAISSSGALFGVTQACSMGQLQTCACVHTRHSLDQGQSGQGQGQMEINWKWGGCSDDVDFGYKKSAQFMDVGLPKGESTRRVNGRTRILLHNNEAGRLVSDSYWAVVYRQLMVKVNKVHIKVAQRGQWLAFPEKLSDVSF